jgi:glycosyl transferase, family 25
MDTPIFVINLPQHTERKKLIEEQFKKFKISNYEIISGIDGKNLSCKDSKNDPIKTYKFISRQLSNTEIGCALSHLKVYKIIVEKKLNYAIVLEDDAILQDGFLENLDLNNCKDILLLGSVSSYHGKFNAGVYEIKRWWEAYCAYGYVISIEGAEKMLSYFIEINHPIDHWYTLCENNISVRWITPVLIKSNDSLPSYIQDDRITQTKNATKY